MLWLWHRPVATAPTGPPAWEPPYAVGAALEKAERERERERETEKQRDRETERQRQRDRDRETETETERERKRKREKERKKEKEKEKKKGRKEGRIHVQLPLGLDPKSVLNQDDYFNKIHVLKNFGEYFLSDKAFV